MITTILCALSLFPQLGSSHGLGASDKPTPKQDKPAAKPAAKKPAAKKARTKAKPAPAGVPKLTPDQLILARDLIRRAETAKPGDWSRCEARLKRLGSGVLPLLDRATPDPLVTLAQKRLRAVMETFPKLRLIATVPAKVPLGKAPKLQFRLRNVWHKPLSVLPALDASDGWRLPRYDLKIFDGAGEPVKFSVDRCGNANLLEARDFKILAPGAELDPFGKETFGHYMLTWKAPVTGFYKATLVLDTRGADAAWETPLDGKISAAAKEKLRALPRLRIVSNTVEFEVR